MIGDLAKGENEIMVYLNLVMTLPQQIALRGLENVAVVADCLLSC